MFYFLRTDEKENWQIGSHAVWYVDLQLIFIIRIRNYMTQVTIPQLER